MVLSIIAATHFFVNDSGNANDLCGGGGFGGIFWFFSWFIATLADGNDDGHDWCGGGGDVSWLVGGGGGGATKGCLDFALGKLWRGLCRFCSYQFFRVKIRGEGGAGGLVGLAKGAVWDPDSDEAPNHESMIFQKDGMFFSFVGKEWLFETIDATMEIVDVE